MASACKLILFLFLQLTTINKFQDADNPNIFLYYSNKIENKIFCERKTQNSSRCRAVLIQFIRHVHEISGGEIFSRDTRGGRGVSRILGTGI